jgi:spermidine synthase
VIALFSATLALSAALVFLVQPMFAKFVLPLYGSTPAVWNTSLVFFQTVLLLAYLYAHASTRRLGVRRQALLHLGLVLVPLVVLPIAVPDDFRPPAEGDQVLSLLGLLAVAVGLPFFVVSATAPLLQRWLASTDHPAAADPYFLYRASNLGSVIGLLGYPLALEPELRLNTQGWVWSGAYGVLVLLLGACAVVTWRSRAAAQPAPPEPVEAPEPITTRRRLRWVGLAFVPSSLMLAVTAFLTIDIAPVPLLWALPLSLYLASFIVAFSTTARADRVHRGVLFALPGVAILLLILLLVDAREPLWLVMPINLAGFFVLALACHGELARDRPPASSLTGFYLLVAVGGALGGVFTGIVVPAVFDSLPEYPLAIVLACLCLPWRAPRVPPWRFTRQLDFALPLAIGALVALVLALVSLDSSGDYEGAGKTFAFGLGAGIALNFIRRPLRFGLAVGAIAIAGSLGIGEHEKELLQERSFFGVYRVTASEDGRLHILAHGTTIHGEQNLSRGRRRVPLTYFHPSAPIGQLMASVRPEMKRRVAIIGLGAGSLACYSRPGDRFTFYELDPTVERIARDPRLFTYLRDCRGRFGVVLGDARLSLERAPDRGYGMLVADAFSSDAIPTHLLTRQALRLYRSKLRTGGVLAFHITNRFLVLEPVVGNLAHDAGLACFAEKEPRRVLDHPRGKIPSHWVAMAARARDLGRVATDHRWHRCRRSGSRAWTDDYSSPLSALKLG